MTDSYSTYDNWITSRRFWTDTLERVLRTTAQVAVAILATPLATTATGVNVSLPWQSILITIGGTAVLTLLTCLAGRGVGDHSTASLTSGTGGPSLQGRGYSGGKHSRAE